MALSTVTKTGASRDTISEGFDVVNTIVTELASTDNGKGASCIGLEDSAGNWTATTVEAFATEASAAITSASGLTNVLNEKDATTTGLTWGYYGGNLRVDNTVTAVSAGTLLLTDDATNYVEINSSGTVSKNTTGFTAGRFPIRTVVCASGAQTTSTDSRAFVQIVPAATATTSGWVELATDAETLTGTATDRATTPANLTAWAVSRFKVTDYIIIPIEVASDGVTATADPADEYTSTNGKDFARTFAHDQTEDIIFKIKMPPDLVAASGIKFQVDSLVTAATGLSDEGLAFRLSGYSIGDGDALNGTYGTPVIVTTTGRTVSQYGVVSTAFSGVVTVTNLAAGEKVMLKFERVHDNAADTYGQLIGVTDVTLEIVRYLET